MLGGGYFSRFFCCSGNRSTSAQILTALRIKDSAAFTVVRESRKANLQVLLSLMSKANCVISVKFFPAFKFQGPGYVC